jgi:hypothetical protein
LCGIRVEIRHPLLLCHIGRVDQGSFLEIAPNLRAL